MTKIKVIKKNNNITEVEAFGHTGYGEHGEDVVCAALSSIVQTAALGLMSVAGIAATIKKQDDTGYFKITLPKSLSERELHDSNLILKTMLAGVSDLSEGYSNFIELEVLDDVY